MVADLRMAGIVVVFEVWRLVLVVRCKAIDLSVDQVASGMSQKASWKQL